MLVLRRNIGEEIVIGENIRIVVLGVHTGTVRIGIEAPAEVPVHRAEVYARIREENRAGSSIEHRAENEAPPEPFFFPRGIAGFSHAHRFAVLYPGRGKVACLQALDAPEVALLVTSWDESRLGAPPKLPPDARKALDAACSDAITWLIVLNPFADPEWLTANIRAPIAICECTRRGVQIVRDEELPLRMRWQRKPQIQSTGSTSTRRRN